MENSTVITATEKSEMKETITKLVILQGIQSKQMDELLKNHEKVSGLIEAVNNNNKDIAQLSGRVHDIEKDISINNEKHTLAVNKASSNDMIKGIARLGLGLSICITFTYTLFTYNDNQIHDLSYEVARIDKDHVQLEKNVAVVSGALEKAAEERLIIINALGISNMHNIK